MRNPYNKAYLFFLRFSLKSITVFNALFQSEEVLVHTLHHESEKLIKNLSDFSKQQPPTSVSGTDGKTDALRTAASEAVAPLGDNDSTDEAAMDAEATPAKRRLNEAGKTSQDTRLRATERRENVPGTKKPRVASQQRSASLTRGGGGGKSTP
ncbi:hypothetical protein HPB49_005274 [Dermacentor silvarum]|uniref:Uncharacterized protein n=1 Tax=Dermacentor silvarum TaxID=543639 RepID=A0ACB8CVJ7_DERSI|nr:hypothetical protein HPB49_005274 [Dermacentor silvarum]